MELTNYEEGMIRLVTLSTKCFLIIAATLLFYVLYRIIHSEIKMAMKSKYNLGLIRPKLVILLTFTMLLVYAMVSIFIDSFDVFAFIKVNCIE